MHAEAEAIIFHLLQLLILETTHTHILPGPLGSTYILLAPGRTTCRLLRTFHKLSLRIAIHEQICTPTCLPVVVPLICLCYREHLRGLTPLRHHYCELSLASSYWEHLLHASQNTNLGQGKISQNAINTTSSFTNLPHPPPLSEPVFQLCRESPLYFYESHTWLLSELHLYFVRLPSDQRKSTDLFPLKNSQIRRL